MMSGVLLGPLGPISSGYTWVLLVQWHLGAPGSFWSNGVRVLLGPRGESTCLTALELRMPISSLPCECFQKRSIFVIPPVAIFIIPPGAIFVIPPVAIFIIPPGAIFVIPPVAIFIIPPGAIFVIPPVAIFIIPPGSIFVIPPGAIFVILLAMISGSPFP
ncbi:hypothetical protein STEG23_019323 [Scotinomys teguina]